MAYRAKDVLKMGFTTVALPGNVVHASAEDVERYGWQDKVEEVADDEAATTARRNVPDTDRPAGA